MKATDLRERTTEDLKELERSLADERFQSQFKNFTNRLDDTSQIRKTRRDLARVKLILAERARGAAPAAPKPEAAGKVGSKGAAAAKKKPADAAHGHAHGAEGHELEHEHEHEGHAHAEPPAKPAKKQAKAGAAQTTAEPKAEKKSKSKPKSTEKTESK